MAKAPLTDLKVRSSTAQDKAYKLTDGAGLYLLVQPNGARYWRMNYRFGGRQGTLAFGVYPDVSLSEARKRRDAAKTLIVAGVDPKEQKKADKQVAQPGDTFETVARRWHTGTLGHAEWKPITATKILSAMENHLFPLIGSHGIAKLQTRDLIAPLRTVAEKGNAVTAARLGPTLVAIFRYAVQEGLISYNPAHDLKGAVQPRKTQHRPALPFNRLTELLQRIENYTKGRELTRLAVMLTLTVFVRSSELRFARWCEIDFDKALWIIPGNREELPEVRYSGRGAKMGLPHLVPLSKQALALFRQLYEISKDYELVFPGDYNPYKPMSENTINKALRTIGYDTKTEVCGHGFRAMACSALTESRLWSKDAVERQMSHMERNEVRGAYTHLAVHMEERLLMMQWWADYLDANREQIITPYEFAGADR
ncbi:DUF4102 domain-containing protein [Yersinia canariae]|uniref:DUF4102 domain-containing protein n=1 Tax=Yersinia canariae TaxID=2607663 RepID=A0A857EXJ4_9GAMM|nr:integrase arm-type DNA-binding domain-containing protein [Yersinia canariae]QHB31970.1 DUF4102 domain-containing protein [Yersinia canariae]